MIYLSKSIPIIKNIYLDDKDFIKNTIKYYCKIYYTKNYDKLYKQKFYESNINNHIFIMYLMEELLYSDFLILYEFYTKFINKNSRNELFKYLIDKFNTFKLKSRNIHNYKMIAKFILYDIEDNI